MLSLFATLWLIALNFSAITFYLKGRKIEKRIEKLLTKLYEQEEQETKGEERETEEKE